MIQPLLLAVIPMAINTASIRAKAKAYCKSEDGKRRIRDMIDNHMLGIAKSLDIPDVRDAGEAFKFVLLDRIWATGSLPARVIEALADLSVGSPSSLDGVGKYSINVSFAKDLTRSSMSTKKDYYDINLADLYNDGVDHVMKQIFERDEAGFLRTSSSFIPHTGFIEEAIDEFMSTLASKFNVERIDRT